MFNIQISDFVYDGFAEFGERCNYIPPPDIRNK